LAECFNVFSRSGVPDDSDAIAELPASFPAEFEFSAVAPCPQSRRPAIVPAARSCRLSARRQRVDVAQFKDGRIRWLYVFLNDQRH